MNVRYILIFLLLTLHLASAQAAQKDPRLKLFIEKYDTLNGRNPPLAHPDSPFFPYHGRNFEEGLDVQQIAKLRKAQEEGECTLVTTLVIDGFLDMFPFLKPAFSAGKRGIYLRVMISTDNRPVLRRCWDHRKRKELLSLHPLEKMHPVDFAKKSSEGLSDLLDPKVPRRALNGFGVRAFCDDYPPSIADLRAIANRPGGMVLTEQEGLYLLERARAHGLGEDDYRQTFERFKKHFSPDANLSRLRTASRAHRLEDIDFKVEGYWQSQCRSVRHYQQDKLRR